MRRAGVRVEPLWETVPRPYAKLYIRPTMHNRPKRALVASGGSGRNAAGSSRCRARSHWNPAWLPPALANWCLDMRQTLGLAPTQGPLSDWSSRTMAAVSVRWDFPMFSGTSNNPCSDAHFCLRMLSAASIPLGRSCGLNCHQSGGLGLWSLWAKGRAVGNPVGGEVSPPVLSTTERSERPGAQRGSSTNPQAGATART